MYSFNPKDYGPVFAPLVAGDRRRPLDAGKPDCARRAELERVTVATAFEGSQLVDEQMAACCVAGVWLLHDFLDESHTISQSIDTPGGSFWHGIMHRREGDFGNAKYWFRRVGEHPAFATIADRAKHVDASLRDASASFGETRLRGWDPFAFVDRCEAAVRGKQVGPTRLSARQAGMPAPLNCDLCLDLQQIEWEALFDCCYRAAVGR